MEKRINDLKKKLPQNYFTLFGNNQQLLSQEQQNILKQKFEKLNKPFFLARSKTPIQIDKSVYYINERGMIEVDGEEVINNEIDNESWFFYQCAEGFIYNDFSDDYFYSLFRAYIAQIPIMTIEHPLLDMIFGNGSYESLTFKKIETKMMISDGVIDLLEKMVNETIKMDIELDEEKINKIEIFMMTHYFYCPQRGTEYDFCLKKNIENPFIKKMFLFVLNDQKPDEQLLSNKKIELIFVDHWITFQEMIDYANENLQNKIICINHLDIFLENKSDNWNNLYGDLDNKILCLSPLETDGVSKIWIDEELNKLLYGYKQDAWIFKTPLNVVNMNIELGELNDCSIFAFRLNNQNIMSINLNDKYKILHFNEIKKEREKKGKKVKNKEKYPVPKYDEFFNKIPIQALIEMACQTDEDIYKLKCYIMSKFCTIEN